MAERFNEAEARASESHLPISTNLRFAMIGFNEAEARASESHPAHGVYQAGTILRFNEAEARASESHEEKFLSPRKYQTVQ